jgi:hypothetical protein
MPAALLSAEHELRDEVADLADALAHFAGGQALDLARGQGVVDGLVDRRGENAAQFCGCAGGLASSSLLVRGGIDCVR